MYDRGEIIQLKKSISMNDLLRHLGFEKINEKNNRAVCLLHAGKNQTSFCWKNDFFNCFSCHRHGDKIDLVRFIRGYDFRQSIQYLSALTGYQLKLNRNYKRKKRKAEEWEIPKYVIEKIANQDYELMQINDTIDKIKSKMSMYTDVLCCLRKDGNHVSEFQKYLELKLTDLDSDMAYWTYQRNQLWKKQR